MHFTTVASALLASALLTSASPSARLAQRQSSCQTAYPESIGFPINYSISQDAGGANKVSDTISFSFPPNSYGCTLRYDFPAGYPITSSGNSQVYIFAESGPSVGSQVGTVAFVSDPNSATGGVINSFACESQMVFEMSIGSQTDAGSVSFADTASAGLTMTYDC